MKKIDELIAKLERDLVKMQEAETSSIKEKAPLNANYFKGCAQGLEDALRDIKRVNESINNDIRNIL